MCRPCPGQLPEEDPSPARWRGQASGKCGGGSAPPARPEHAGIGNQLGGTQQLREHWRSPLNWVGRLFGKPLHLLGYTSWLKFPLPNFPTLFKSFKTKQKQKREEEKQRKEKHTSFGKRFFTHRKAAEAPWSLHPLCKILREDATAFLQFLVLIPVALLHTHEPAFILGQQSTGSTGAPHNTQSTLGPKPTREEQPTWEEPTSEKLTSEEPTSEEPTSEEPACLPFRILCLVMALV